MSHKQDLSAFGIEDRSYTIEEWQVIERETGQRLEYHEGRLVRWQVADHNFARYSLLVNNFVYCAHHAIRQDDARFGDCSVYGYGIRVNLGDGNRYVYPGAVIDRGLREFDDQVEAAMYNPVAVLAVRPVDSLAYGSTRKFEYYQQLGNLRTYITVSQNSPLVEVRTRAEGSEGWYFEFTYCLEAVVKLPGLGIEFSMADLYRGIAFEEEQPVTVAM